MQVIDFANSYQFWMVPAPTSLHAPIKNSARIQLDARCEIYEESTGVSEEFFLITPCRTERMYLEENLFQVPNKEYCVITSRTHDIRVASGLVPDKPRRIKTVAESFLDYRFIIRHYPRASLLETEADIIRATDDLLPLVAVTELRFPERGVRAVLEYPIKTMNVNREYGRFQVDTGPVALPLPEYVGSNWLEGFHRAFAVYNRFDLAEFVVEQPTPLVVDGQAVATVRDFQAIRVLPARHQIFAGEGDTL